MSTMPLMRKLLRGALLFTSGAVVATAAFFGIAEQPGHPPVQPAAIAEPPAPAKPEDVAPSAEELLRRVMAANSASEAAFAEAVDSKFAELHDKLTPTPRYGIERAGKLTPQEFKKGVQSAIKSIYGIDGCRENISAEYITRRGVWEERLIAGRNPVPVRTLSAIPPNPTRRPVVVIDDGMGVRHTAGIDAPRYEGEDVARFLYEAGHPVLIIGLTGFEDTLYPGLWGISGINQYYVLQKAAGRDLAVVWVQDAVDATCFFFQNTSLAMKDFGLVGVSKSGVISAILAHFFKEATRVYLASSFSTFEQNYAMPSPYHYATGERLYYDNAGLLAALYKEKVRLSYSTKDSEVYASEARNGNFVKLINEARERWKKKPVEQFGRAPFHYFDRADVTAFFG